MSVCEGVSAFDSRVSGFSAFEPQVIVNASLSFFWGKFFNSYGIYVHGIWVFLLLSIFLVIVVPVVKEGEEGVSSTFHNVIGFFPDMFEGESLGIPLFYGVWDSVHRVNFSHNLSGGSS